VKHAFSPGDRVHVTPFGTAVVREARNGGRYLVDVKGRSMVVNGDQLVLADPPRKTRVATRSVVETTAPVPATTSLRASLDLHGKTVVEALEALDEFLNDALVDGASEVQVIHGRSGGTLKAAVHRRLEVITSVRNFRIDPRNEGMTIVTF
jgi:DNA mismatch repair protein MutS2